jgi:heme-degrading monooxygenase HmoA
LIAVFARVSTYEVPPDKADDATDTFRQAIGEIRKLNGLVTAYVLVNADSGRVVTMTLWENASVMEASRMTASRLRREAVRALDGDVLSTEEYEVAARELGDLG